MPEAQEQYDKIADGLASQPNVRRVKMFGKPCVSVNGNGFLALFEDGLAAKLSSQDRSAALSLEGAQLWDPSGMGRPMKEWVFIPSEHLPEWGSFAEAALGYVSTLPAK
jgi:hypothetical protein